MRNIREIPQQQPETVQQAPLRDAVRRVGSRIVEQAGAAPVRIKTLFEQTRTSGEIFTGVVGGIAVVGLAAGLEARKSGGDGKSKREQKLDKLDEKAGKLRAAGKEEQALRVERQADELFDEITEQEPHTSILDPYNDGKNKK